MAIRALGFDPKSPEIREMIVAVDQDNSNSIEFFEFKTMMTVLLSQQDSEVWWRTGVKGRFFFWGGGGNRLVHPPLTLRCHPSLPFTAMFRRI